ncbi:MAG TPA: DNA topoisomerase, partial [Bacteroidia bacterium]|nr:DNA topoisomerase [Bacteroidia bacterium]
MVKNLLIVESPAKAKTIEKYLGKDFTVKSSVGHIRDLPEKGIGIDIKHNFKPDYVVSADKKKIVAELKKLAKAADTVWLATDEDREGEAIAWHLFEELDISEKKAKRVVYHEITKSAILEAIKHPREINKDLVDAQQARRVLDRLVGYELSPILWKKIKPALSAGRVQSVAVRLIVEREREISAFILSPYYKVLSYFTANNIKFRAELEKRLIAEKDASDLLNKLIGAEFFIQNQEKKPSKRTPSAPFTTSTLQQEASRKLGFSVLQ